MRGPKDSAAEIVISKEHQSLHRSELCPDARHGFRIIKCLLLRK